MKPLTMNALSVRCNLSHPPYFCDNGCGKIVGCGVDDECVRTCSCDSCKQDNDESCEVDNDGFDIIWCATCGEVRTHDKDDCEKCEKENPQA